jgi:aspergillopepsin I
MWKQGLSAPVFSLALQRNNGGYIAFGGLPPAGNVGAFAATALQEFNGLAGSAFTGQSFYTITPDALVFPGATTRQTNQFIIDSGTTLNHLPTNTARAINSLFSPKATQTDGVWVVACNARAPQFGVRIGGQNFMINPVDMIFKDETTGLCVSAIQDGGAAPGPFVLGDQFLNNVVAVFDVGAAQMRFAPHSY